MSRATHLRLALFYAAYFGTVGVWLPFWPVWLAGRHLDPSLIGLVLAVGFWIRLLVNPFVAWVADARGERRRPMVVLGTAALVTYGFFALAREPWHFLVLSGLTGASFTVLVPFADSVTLDRVRSDGVDYGRVRLWGSLAFIVTSVAGGQLLSRSAPDRILWLVVGGVGVTLVACFLGPGVRTPARRQPPRARDALRLTTSGGFVLLVAACAFVQASHAPYYGFATLSWMDAGRSETVVGLLWAEGVVAEILLFFVGARLTARLHPATLIALGGASGVLRWTVLAVTTHPAALIAVQALHAGTFAATHLGAMTYLGRSVPAALSATAQTVYSTLVGGVALGLAMSVSGTLYEAHGARAFLLGTALAGAGTVLALWLRRRPVPPTPPTET